MPRADICRASKLTANSLFSRKNIIILRSSAAPEPADDKCVYTVKLISTCKFFSIFVLTRVKSVIHQSNSPRVTAMG